MAVAPTLSEQEKNEIDEICQKANCELIEAAFDDGLWTITVSTSFGAGGIGTALTPGAAARAACEESKKLQDES